MDAVCMKSPILTVLEPLLRDPWPVIYLGGVTTGLCNYLQVPSASHKFLLLILHIPVDYRPEEHLSREGINHLLSRPAVRRPILQLALRRGPRSPGVPRRAADTIRALD